MTKIDAATLGRARTAFALSAGITIIFNTVIACAKDAYTPLKLFMASLSDHDWTTQGLADVALFVGLGFLFLRMPASEKVGSARVISFLVTATIAAGAAMFAWYVVY